MPKRPLQHVIASRAVASVRKLWADQGCAVDEINEDYGEDLLVQTSLDEQMDFSRIWAQVKGTGQDCSDPTRALPSVRVNAKQVLRWAYSADLVIVVLWDTVNDQGWFARPRDFPDFARLRGDGEVQISFSRQSPFSLESVQRLVWEARLGHYEKELHHALSCVEEAKETGSDSDEAYYLAVVDVLQRNLLRDLKITNASGRWSDDFLEVFDQCGQKYPHDLPELTAEHLADWVMDTVFHTAARAGAYALPTAVISMAMQSIIGLFAGGDLGKFLREL